jgi:hypothetical protein
MPALLESSTRGRVVSRRSPKPDDLSFAGDCQSCGCTPVSCGTKVWLSGRSCCEDCDHDQPEPLDQTDVVPEGEGT